MRGHLRGSRGAPSGRVQGRLPEVRVDVQDVDGVAVAFGICHVCFFFSSRVEKTLQLSPLLFIFSSFASLFSSFFERERDSRKISTSNRK